MYVIGHTSHTLIALSSDAERKVRDRKAKSKVNFGSAFYRTVIKNEVWTFFEEYTEAKGAQALLFLDGAQT